MATKIIGTLGTIDTITVGGRVITDTTTNLVVLVGSALTAAHYTTFRQANSATPSTSGYQVPGGKIFTALGGRMFSNGTNQQISLIVSGTTDVGIDSASVPTSGIYVGGNVNNVFLQGPLAFTPYENMGPVPFAAATYPAFQINVGAETVVWLWGYTQ